MGSFLLLIVLAGVIALVASKWATRIDYRFLFQRDACFTQAEGVVIARIRNGRVGVEGGDGTTSLGIEVLLPNETYLTEYPIVSTPTLDVGTHVKLWYLNEKRTTIYLGDYYIFPVVTYGVLLFAVAAFGHTLWGLLQR